MTDYITQIELSNILIKTDFDKHGLNTYERNLLLAITSFVNHDTTNGYKAWPSIETLIARSGISKTSIERYKPILVEKDFVRCISGKKDGQSNIYYVNGQKLIDCFVASGGKKPEKRVAPYPDVDVAEQHQRNTSGLKQGKQKPAQTVKVAPVVSQPFEPEETPYEAPKTVPVPKNPDGSHPYHPNGMRCYSWKDYEEAPEKKRIEDMNNEEDEPF